MKVWILEQGTYDERSVVGVYATAELAMELNPDVWEYNATFNDWNNNKDFSDFRHLYLMDVEVMGQNE
jgi:hypothetical protein